jgi:DNA-binding SARP family transcriptional activator
MLRLKLLGSLDFRDRSGAEIRPVLQQPKRLALLTYLALTPSGGFRRRDSLVGLFWPDLDGEHARGALRRSLYFLRRACGDDVIISRGEDDVGLRPGALWCDVAAFEAALAAGNHIGALALYGGDLLEGFYVAGAPAMEQWLDMERTRLRASAAKAAWTAADAAGSNGAGVTWARRAVDLAPDEDRGVRRLMTMLDQGGDAAGAIRAYDDYATRLGRDLELEPSPETTALVATIRKRSTPARTPHATASAFSPTPPADNVLAICPFVVRGARDLAYLGEGMIDLLSNALDGAGDLRTVDPRAVLAAPSSSLDASGGGDTDALALAVGAGLLVSGTIIRAGDSIRVAAALYRTGHGRLGRVEAQAAGEDGLFGAVDELARGLVTLLSQAPGTYPAQLAARTSRSWPALKAFLQGEHEFRLGRHTRALAAFEHAVELDNSFALAHYRLAGTRAAAAMLVPARQACRTANGLSGSLATSAQRMLEAQDAWLHGRLALAEQRYGAIVAEHPDNVEAWYLLGDVLFHGNACRGRSPVEARTALQRALALDGTHVGALGKLARIAAMEGEEAALDLYVDRVVALSPGGEQALTLRALRAFRRGDLGELMRLAGDLRSARMFAVGVALGDAALYSGRLDAVESIARELIPRVPSAELRALGHLFLAEAALADARADQARRDYEAAGELDPAWSLTVLSLRASSGALPCTAAQLDSLQEELERWNAASELARVSLPLMLHDGLYGHIRAYVAGLVAARRGDLASTARWTEELAELVVPDGAEVPTEHMLRTLEATLRAGQGDADGGLHALQGARTEVWFQYAMASPVFAGVEGRLLRAGLLQQQGRTREAAGWFGSIGWHSVWELSHRTSARRRAMEIATSMEVTA